MTGENAKSMLQRREPRRRVHRETRRRQERAAGRGHRSCASPGVDDSASLGSSLLSARRGLHKVPSRTPDLVRGRGAPKAGYWVWEAAREAAGKTSFRAPRALPDFFPTTPPPRAPRERLRLRCAASCLGSAVNPRSRGIRSPKPRVPASQDGLAPHLLPLPALPSRPPPQAAAARTPGLGGRARALIGSPRPGSGSLGPLRRELMPKPVRPRRAALRAFPRWARGQEQL